MKLHDVATNKETVTICTKERQAALVKTYKSEPEKALVIDRARTCSEISDINNPMGAKLLIDKSDQPICVGVDYSVGGDSKNSTPGDILCGALAACLDTSIRLIAKQLRLSLK